MSARRNSRVPVSDPPKSGVVTGNIVQIEPDCIRVWVASGIRETRQKVTKHLSTESGITVIGSSGDDYARLAAELEQHRPDLLLLDGRCLERLDARYLKPIRSYATSGRVLLLLDEADRQAAIEVLRNGFHGYLLLPGAGGVYARAIRAVSRGDIWIPRSLLAEVLGNWLSGGDAPVFPAAPPAADTRSLTARERQVFAHLKVGLSNKQIAAELGVLEDTVKKHLHHVYNKLGVHRRTLVLASEARV